MPTPKRPSARCAEGLSFCPGIAPSPKDGGDDGAGTASIRRGDGERPVAGWDRTVNRMEGRRSGDGAVLRGERSIFRHSSLCRRSGCRPALSDIWRPSSSADLTVVRALCLSLLLRDRMGTAPLQTGLLFLCGETGRAYRGAFRRVREVCADTASIRCRRWSVARGRMKLHDERDGVCSVGDGGGLGRDRSRCVLGKVQRMHGNIHPCCFFGTDMLPETSMCSAIRFDCFFRPFSS